MTRARLGTLPERYEEGVNLRRRTPHPKHADLLGPDRDAIAILAARDRGRIPNLIALRYERMLTNPFAFMRGSAAVMAQDLQYQPRAGIVVQACGDCHLMNFGAFVTPEENILFDINDFDETLPGIDFTVDLKRLVASVAVAALAEQFSRKKARAATAATVKAYRTHMRRLSKLSPIEIWRSKIELTQEVEQFDDQQLRRKVHAILTKIGKKLDEDDNFPHLVKGKPSLIADKPPLIYHLPKKKPCGHYVDPQRLFGSYRECLSPERLSSRAIRHQRCRFQSRGGRELGNVLRCRPIHERRWRSAIPASQRSEDLCARMFGTQVHWSRGPADC
jgi:hypothetical protein